MTIEKVRVLAEKNTMGIPKVIYIKGDNLQELVKTYENIQILLTEEEALSYGLKNAIDNEVIVSFSQFLDKTMPVVNKFIIL